MSQSYLSNSKKSDTSSTSSTISNKKNLDLASDSIKKAQRDIQTGNLAGANTENYDPRLQKNKPGQSIVTRN